MVRQSNLTLYPVHFPTVKRGQNLSRLVYKSLANEGLTLKRADLLAVASKIVSACEGRLAKLTDTSTNYKTRRLAKRWKMDEKLATLVAKEADQIVGGVDGFMLTVKRGILTPNAGVDLKNSPPGTATLWPSDPDKSAAKLRRNLERRYHTTIGVEIVDSHVTPLRMGTVGLAIGTSGFVPLRDNRGIRDIFGRPIRVTQANVADDLSAAAHLLMGESKEHVGAVLIRGAQITINPIASSELAKLSWEKCLVGSSLLTPKLMLQGSRRKVRS